MSVAAARIRAAAKAVVTSATPFGLSVISIAAHIVPTARTAGSDENKRNQSDSAQRGQCYKCFHTQQHGGRRTRNQGWPNAVF